MVQNQHLSRARFLFEISQHESKSQMPGRKKKKKKKKRKERKDNTIYVGRTEQGPGPPENPTRTERFWMGLRIFGSGFGSHFRVRVGFGSGVGSDKYTTLNRNFFFG